MTNKWELCGRKIPEANYSHYVCYFLGTDNNLEISIDIQAKYGFMFHL
jgi:hypothetical protein